MITNFSIDPGLLPLRGVVYLLRNTVNGKVYVGLTRQPLRKRLNGHRTRCANRYLAAAIAKHGLPAFRVEVVASGLSRRRLSVVEKKTIRELRATEPEFGYNLTHGGEHFKPTKALRAHLSEVCRGWRHTPEARAKISRANMGCKKMLGKKHSAEARSKIVAAGRGRKWTRAQREANTRWWAVNRERMSRHMAARKITWGAKISVAKTKLSLGDFEDFVRTHPSCSLAEVRAAFGLRSNAAIHRHGGLLATKARVLGPEFARKRGQVVVPDLIVGRAKSLRSEGASLRAISRELKVSPRIVARVLREKG